MDNDSFSPGSWTFGWILLLTSSLVSAARDVETGSVAARLASAAYAVTTQKPEAVADFTIPLFLAGVVMGVAWALNRKRENFRASRVFLITAIVLFGMNVLGLLNASIRTTPLGVETSQSTNEFAEKCACPLELAAVNDKMVLEQKCLGFRVDLPVAEYEVLPPQVLFEYATQWAVKRKDENGMIVFVATSLNEYSESALNRYSKRLRKNIMERAGLEASEGTASRVVVIWGEQEKSATVDLIPDGARYIAKTLMESGGRLNASWIVTVQCLGYDSGSAREIVESLHIFRQDNGS